MADRAPDRVDGLYWTMFTRNDERAEAEGGDHVQIHLRGTHTLVEPLGFKLPRQARAFESMKLALNAAFELGRAAAQADIRDALGIKECTHDD